jgi:uncharacterized protein
MGKITSIMKSANRGPIERNQQRKDGWENLVTLLGTSADKRTASRIRWDYHDPEFYEQLYAAGGIPARIVDVIPEQSLRHWIEWSNVDKKTQKIINERCKSIGLREAILKSWKWGRAYGGACLHIVTDTPDPASPLRRGEKIIGLRDLSRWDLRILTTDVEYDFGSPNFGHPRIYYLNVQMGSQYKGYPIHWTRMIRFDGQLVPRRTYIRNNYWHDSILNRLYNSIRNYENANDAAAACLMDFNVDVFKMKNLSNLISSGNEALVKSRLDMVEYAKSVINAMIIDADDEDYENKGRSLEGVAELLVHQANRLVAETDMPHTVLLGESPDGSSATGNSTSQQWYNFIGTEQENYLRPKLDHVLDVLFYDMPGLEYKFKSLRVLDDTEKADVRLKVAQTDQIYIGEGVLDPTEIANSRFGGDEYSIETTLDKEGRENGSVVPGQQSMEEGSQEKKDPDDEDGDGSAGASGSGEHEHKADAMHVAGIEPPEGRSVVGNNPGPSEPEPAADFRGTEGSQHDITGVEPHGVGVEGQGIGDVFSGLAKPGTEFDPNNDASPGEGSKPVSTFISQTMSEPMRDPRTDPAMKGPGIPNKARLILPTRGTGIMAPSGAVFGESQDNTSTSIEHEKKVDAEESPKRRAATVIVKHGDKFLMGPTNKDGRYTMPGGKVEDGESMHQGAIRELAEETGIQAKRLKWLGTRLVESEMGKPTEVAMYEYNHPEDEKIRPTTRKDPDNEVKKWEWFSHKEPLHKDVLGNLKHANNIALDHMGLLR